VAVFRRLMGVAAVTVTAGLAVAGCAPVKFGAAAVVGNQRITVAQLGTETGQLATAVKEFPGIGKVTSLELTQETLTWLSAGPRGSADRRGHERAKGAGRRRMRGCADPRAPPDGGAEPAAAR